MANKTLQTRLKLKYDTYDNWQASELILLEGEAAICTIPAGKDETGMQNLPNTMIKIGDGVNRFSDLPWLSALAANAYSWALQPNKPTYAATEITGLDEYIGGKVEDTNTTYQIMKVNEYQYKLQQKNIGDESWTDTGTTIDIPNDTEAITALETLVGETPVATQIANAINALTVADEAVTNQFVTAVSQTNGKIAVTRAALQESNIPALSQSKITGLSDALAAKQDKITFNSPYDASSNKAATMADITSAVGGLSGAMHFEGVEESVPEDNAGYESGDVILVGNKEYVFDGTEWHELGDETIYAIKGEITNADISPAAVIDQSKIANLTTDLANKATTEQLNNLEEAAAQTYETKTDATAKIAALAKEDTPVENQVVTAVSQTNGVISVTRRGLAEADIPAIGISKVTGLQDSLNEKANDSELAAIAKTGSVADLVEDAGTLFILNCGSSSVNIG